MKSRDEIPHVQGESASHETVVQLLREQGCVVVDSLVTGASLADARDELKRLIAEAPVGERDFDGRATRRVYDPLARTRVLDDWVLHPLLTATVQALLGPSQFGMTILSAVQPGEVAQFLHRDAAIYPLPAEVGPVEVNTIWAIDEFTRANGATVLVPGSHVGGTPPSAYDWESLTVATMSAGSVLVYDGRVVHGAGANTTTSARLGLIVEHTVRWLRPAENHSLAVSPAVVATLPAHLQELLGYNQHSAFLGFVAGRPPGEWLHDRAASHEPKPERPAE
ncbi:MAG TPA: phytanoyl-CoA dioxygenase family protein [Acidimicrobiales bacterium]|nr:phytanoyl-CoA dioxygenase family protein [Acidimicrobiales bacterium]